jgi:branched-chain amino acid transport system permease protein
MSTLLIVFLNGLAFAGVLFLLSSGLTLVLGLARVVNFAHGSIYILGGYLFLTVVNLTGSWWLGLFIAPLILGIIGGIIEIFLLRPIYKKEELLQLILTFGLVLIIEDLIKMIWGNVPYSTNILPSLLSGFVTVFGKAFPKSSLWTIFAAALTCFLLWLLLTRTRLGKQINAASSDMEMAEALGIDVSRLFTSVFVLGAICAGIGGSLLTLKVGLLPPLGLEYLIYAFAVVVIGGLGSYKGSICGALIVGIAHSFGILIIPDFAMVLVFALLLLTLLIRPRGLFGVVEEIRASTVTVEKKVKFDLSLLMGGKVSSNVMVAIGGIALVCFIVLLPLIASGFWVIFITEILVLMLLATSLNLLLRAGMLSLAHGAFFGAGAYTASLLLIHFTNSLLLSLVLSIAMAATLAFFIGLLSLRHVEIYFALLTLAFAQFVYTVIFKWQALTGGDDGLIGIPLPSLNIFGLTGDIFTPDSEAKYLYLVLAFTIICLLALRMVLKSPFGQILHAIRENPERVMFLGINPDRYKLAGFVIAGCVAGLAGAIFAPFQMVISPIAAHWTKAVDPLFMNILGGVNSMLGPSVGAVVFTIFKDWLSSLMEYWRILFGLILVLAALLFPRGLVEYAKMGFSKIFERSQTSQSP